MTIVTKELTEAIIAREIEIKRLQGKLQDLWLQQGQDLMKLSGSLRDKAELTGLSKSTIGRYIQIASNPAVAELDNLEGHTQKELVNLGKCPTVGQTEKTICPTVGHSAVIEAEVLPTEENREQKVVKFYASMLTDATDEAKRFISAELEYAIGAVELGVTIPDYKVIYSVACDLQDLTTECELSLEEIVDKAIQLTTTRN